MKDYKILYQIKDLEKNILRNINICTKLDKKELPTSLTQIQIIKYIIDNYNQDIYQKDLEDKLNLRRATISGVLKTMEKNKLIERISNKQDQRSKKIILNKKISKKITEHFEKVNEIENIIIKNISKEELEIFSNVLNKMKYNINSD